MPGCNAMQACQAGLNCCADDVCHDFMNDVMTCGTCDNPCPTLANSTPSCVQGQCESTCNAGFADCNGTLDDGCEQDLANGPCACTPGDTQPCYTGPAGTENVGACKGGTQTCNPQGTGWGACIGETKPQFDACSNGVDDDCDGTVDNTPDLDGDGWTKCNGDCCDALLDGCGNPNLVNPGAFEVDGNMVDDDCDGTVDNALATCDSGLASNSGNALDYAKAIDLCPVTTANPPIAQKKWGVITAAFFRANGAGAPPANAKSIRTGFGQGVTPLKGNSFSVLSTGVAAASAAPNNTSPNNVAPQTSSVSGVTSPVPTDWLQANGNNFPNAPGCPDPQGGTTANDPIMLKLSIRVPTNANSFSFSSNFYSSEYPEWVCSAFNDFYLALLTSTFLPGPGQVANPADKNLAFYDPPPAGAPYYPVGVNLAFGNTGLFTQCKNGATGCGGGAVPGNTNTCQATNMLVGTGFDVVNPASPFAGDPGYCGANNLSGGATGWLTTSGNVKPGEVIDLRFVIWDTGDGYYDSTVLIDNFQWSVTASTPGTE